MWFKKDVRKVNRADIDATLLNISSNYRILSILKPRYFDPDSSYNIIVWVYLGTENGYVVTVEKVQEEAEHEE